MAAKRDTPRIAVILGSPGVQAFAGLPLVERFRKHGIPVDLVLGTSGGGLLAALWGGGYDLEQICGIFAKLDAAGIFADIDEMSAASLRTPYGRTGTAQGYGPSVDGGKGFDAASGLFRGDNLRGAYSIVFKGLRLEELDPLTVLCCTDVTTGGPVFLESGLVADAVYASGASYPLLPPASIRGSLLADGSFCNPLPVLEAVKRGMDIIVTVSLEDRVAPEPSNILDCFLNMQRISQANLARSQLFAGINVHHYEIISIRVPFDEPVGQRDVKKVTDLLRAGRKAVDDRLDEVRAVIEGFSGPAS